MPELNEWLDELGKSTPSLSDFITKVQRFIAKDTFDAAKFEKAVDNGLKQAEQEAVDYLKKSPDAEN